MAMAPQLLGNDLGYRIADVKLTHRSCTDDVHVLLVLVGFYSAFYTPTCTCVNSFSAMSYMLPSGIAVPTGRAKAQRLSVFESRFRTDFCRGSSS
jgi:hypothetical protein